MSKAHRRATSRGMRRWWRKRKARQNSNYSRMRNLIKLGRLQSKDVNQAYKANALRKDQTESLKEMLKRRKTKR